jgi:hypothetical protein
VKITVPRMLLFILLEVLVLLIAFAVFANTATVQEVETVHTRYTIPPTDPKYGTQIAMIVDRTEDTKKIVIPQAIVWYRFAPLSGPTAKAPLSKGDIMLCNAFDMKDQEGGMHIAERCGEDVYLVDSVGMRVK